MTLLIKACDDVVSLIDTSKDKVLSCIKGKYKKEFYLSNSSLDRIENPYQNIEQALDDFEYLTNKLPSRVITAFKNRIKGTVMKNSSSKEEFKITCEDEICSLECLKDNCQLLYFPVSSTNTGEPEFSILSLDFEPIKDYEVLEDNFADDVDEAIQILEDITGELPLDIIRKFKKEITTLENSSKKLIKQIDDTLYSYSSEDLEVPFELTYDKDKDTLVIDSLDGDNIEILNLGDYTYVEIIDKLKDLYKDINIFEIKEVLVEFDKLANR